MKALIDVVQPHAILFTTGPGYDKYLKSSFPEGAQLKFDRENRLAMFNLNQTLCLRTCHPRYAKDNVWRAKAVQMISDLGRTTVALK